MKYWIVGLLICLLCGCAKYKEVVTFENVPFESYVILDSETDSDFIIGIVNSDGTLARCAKVSKNSLTGKALRHTGVILQIQIPLGGGC